MAKISDLRKKSQKTIKNNIERAIIQLVKNEKNQNNNMLLMSTSNCNYELWIYMINSLVTMSYLRFFSRNKKETFRKGNNSVILKLDKIT